MSYAVTVTEDMEAIAANSGNTYYNQLYRDFIDPLCFQAMTPEQRIYSRIFHTLLLGDHFSDAFIDEYYHDFVFEILNYSIAYQNRWYTGDLFPTLTKLISMGKEGRRGYRRRRCD